MEKKIIRASDYLPEPQVGSGGGQDFELPVSEQMLYGLFGTSPDYKNQQFEDIWQEVIDAEDADTVAFCLENGVDVIGNDGEKVPGWRDVAVMLKAIARGLLTLNESEATLMKTIDDVLNRVTEDIGAMIPRPASKKDLRLCQKDMAEMGFPPIPQGYADFLSKLNGFAWNGIEFFSTDQVTDDESGYTLNDIVSANEDFVMQNDAYALEHCVYLGRADEDLYVYNTKNEKYEVLDFTSRDVMEEYGNFGDMFVGVVAPRI